MHVHSRQMSPAVRVAALVVVWILWFLPFFLHKRRTPKVAGARIDRRARFGVLLQMFGFFIAFTHGPKAWAMAIPVWRAVAGACFAIAAVALAWTAVGHLGRQWRIDAGLNPDHELVRTGAYRFVRHPIYSSMLWLFSTGVAWIGTLPGWPVALALMIAGIEVRVRVEDGLLRSRFGGAFIAWQRQTSAYLPFIR
jgi:protein-S-isoprenylcysteine O-methyltransferase Ste14